MYPFRTGGKKKYEGIHVENGKLNLEFKNSKGVARASAAKGQLPNLYFRIRN
jgi:hypothetical protein